MEVPDQLHLAILIIATTIWTLALAQITELTYILAEERPALTLVGNVLDDSNVRSQVSPHEILDLRFTFLTEKNPHTLLMWINSTSGELRTSSRINRETICQKLPSCELKLQTVIQAQLGSFFKIIQLKITITDINDNKPIFIPSNYTIKIQENTIPGALFRLPTAVDLDSDLENSVFEYNQVATLAPFSLIVNGSGSLFDVQIRLTSNLDRETIPFYQIVIQAVDGGRPRLTGTLSVNLEIVDVNDNSPVFLQQEYNANISDSLAVGSVVVVVKATDQDAGDNGLVRYHLASLQNDLFVFEMFDVDGSTGEVKTKVTLDSYAGRNYRLTIEAQDLGSSHKTSRTELIISVVDTHNSQPEILLNVFGAGGVAHVSELAELGRVVAHLAVTDPDSNMSANGQVSCLVNMADQFQLQPMDVRQFKVILTRRLDREQQPTHSVTILCEDSGTPPLNASSRFTVVVEDENDNAPEFNSSYYATEVIEGKINDSGDNNHIILTVNASDMDNGQNAQLTYRLADGADSDFGLYTDGSLVITNPAGLDREDTVKGGVRHLIVLAVDSGKPQLTGTTTVVITILDINDNSPTFTEPVYFFQVAENVALNHNVNNISAVDLDLGSNGSFYFKMHPRYVNKIPFEVSPTGTVQLSGDVDRETVASYQFFVIANDIGNPQQSSSVEIKIQITDVNDNVPEFVFPSNDNDTIYIPHTHGVQTVVANIHAKDADEGRNAELVYVNNGGNSSQYFDVRSESGQIVLLQELTSKELGLHILSVSVHDRGVNVQLTRKCILHVIVYEGNVTDTYKDYDISVRNVTISIALVVITIILAFTIFVTILIIRRVDKQRRVYSTTTNESRAQSELKQINSYLTGDPDSFQTTPSVKDTTKNEDKKKKEVSFVLKGRTTNNMHEMWVTSPADPDKYDSLSERLQEELNRNNSAQHDDDNGSDSSANIKACDSGKGDSDVEVQSGTGVPRDTGETTMFPQYTLDHGNNHCLVSNPNFNTNCRNYRNTRKPLQFQKSSHGPLPVGILESSNTPNLFWSRVRPPTCPSIPHINSGVNISRHNQNGVSPENESFVNKSNSRHFSHVSGNNNNITLKDRYLPNQNKCYLSSTNQKRYSMCLSQERFDNQQSGNSNFYFEETGARDGDTTTSGSYTVDPLELSDEIDTFFLERNRDVVV